MYACMYISKGNLNSVNTRGKPGIEKSMKTTFYLPDWAGSGSNSCNACASATIYISLYKCSLRNYLVLMYMYSHMPETVGLSPFRQRSTMGAHRAPKKLGRLTIATAGSWAAVQNFPVRGTFRCSRMSCRRRQLLSYQWRRSRCMVTNSTCIRPARIHKICEACTERNHNWQAQKSDHQNEGQLKFQALAPHCWPRPNFLQTWMYSHRLPNEL